MTKQDYHIRINLTLNSEMPLHIGTGLGVIGVVDKGVNRDQDGNVFIPGSSIKGRLRYHFIQLYDSFIGSIAHNGSKFCLNDMIQDCCPVCQIFGSRFHQGRFIFANATSEYPEIKSIEINRSHEIFRKFQTIVRRHNKISRRRKTAEEKHLFALEAAVPKLAYSTSIDGTLTLSPGESSAPKEVALLLASIKMLEKLGGGKSRGLGRVKAEIEATVNGTSHNFSELLKSLKS